MKNTHNISEVTEAYLVCALWSSNDGDDPLEAKYGTSDISGEAWERAEVHVRYFIDRAGPWLGDDQDEEQIGHDFWLTRNGHGAGFWGRDLPDGRGEVLSDICGAMGEQDIYPGDDGELYLS